jgi:hypothetical protein
MNEAQDAAAVRNAIKAVDELNQRRFEALKLLGSVVSVADSAEVLNANRVRAYMLLGRMEAIGEIKALLPKNDAQTEQIIDTTAN